ncbi:hypothetical protein GCM10010103_64860 [Streptomyces paradoxus]|uniref:Uncharacterized membrane protein YjjB (DUF3815 family) n=1 Tax=Streptomyces paradoxus TaxID=66375 RepID=A0A7W9TI75_9ACTN|nr:hypothetical protein [Streptomyces paradoxus]MBB6081104.1 uncharacterized membrane protein YjjB (DUF3815 family) [Streptomyces paradoxus]
MWALRDWVDRILRGSPGTPPPTPEGEPAEAEAAEFGAPEVAAVEDYPAAIAAYRQCAQWLTAAIAAVAAVFVAGLQVSVLQDLTVERAVLGFLAAAVVVGCAGYIISRAANVLSPAEITMVQLARDSVRLAQAAGARRRPQGLDKGTISLITDINANKGLLFPVGVRTISDLYHLACGHRLRRQHRLPNQATAHRYTRSLMDFVELQQIRKRYKSLLKALPWSGLVALAAVLGFVLLAHKDESPPKVTSPLPVQIFFTDDKKALRSEQWPEGCARKVPRGTAVGGSLKEPEVAIPRVDDACPQHRGTVSTRVGVVIYPK